jgi:hypothetical protein
VRRPHEIYPRYWLPGVQHQAVLSQKGRCHIWCRIPCFSRSVHLLNPPCALGGRGLLMPTQIVDATAGKWADISSSDMTSHPITCAQGRSDRPRGVLTSGPGKCRHDRACPGWGWCHAVQACPSNLPEQAFAQPTLQMSVHYQPPNRQTPNQARPYLEGGLLAGLVVNAQDHSMGTGPAPQCTVSKDCERPVPLLLPVLKLLIYFMQTFCLWTWSRKGETGICPATWEQQQAAGYQTMMPT